MTYQISPFTARWDMFSKIILTYGGTSCINVLESSNLRIRIDRGACNEAP